MRKPSFELLYGEPAAVQADAPGRVNLIGEHTDYNGGFVLPTAIPQRTRVELSPRPGDTVRCWSADVGETNTPLSYELGREHPRHDWLDYVQGVSYVLRADGQRIGGFELRIESDVPFGSGLSSSAALEVSLLRALRQAFGLALDDVQLALVGQQAENEFVGARVGIMDQFAASLADTKTALFVDTRSLDFERVPLPTAAEIVVIDSGVKHSHASGEYNQRRAQCEQASTQLGVGQLRDLTTDDLPRIEALPAPLNRRARHVVTENARVLETVAAIRAGELERLGRLLEASHQSLRHDYEVSITELDLLVELAQAQPAVYGARMTGGGFGGAVVVLVQAGSGPEVAASVAQTYAERSGRAAGVLVPAARSTA